MQRFCQRCNCKKIDCHKTHNGQVCIHGIKDGCGKSCFSCPDKDKCCKKKCEFIHPDETCIHNVLSGCNRKPLKCRNYVSCTSSQCKKFHSYDVVDYFPSNTPVYLHDLNSYVVKNCKKWKIDSSHGIEHSWRVKDLILFMCRNDQLSEWATKICVIAGMLHDMVDHKYCKTEKELEEARSYLERWLVKKLKDTNSVELVLQIIDNMSYSKCKENKKNFDDAYYYFNHYLSNLKGTEFAVDESTLWNMFHIVRHADVLDAYDPARCLVYVQETRHPNFSYDMQFKIVYDLFVIRMFKYISDGWLFREDIMPIAIKEEQKAYLWFVNEQLKRLTLKV